MATELRPADREGSISSKVSPSPSYNIEASNGVKQEANVHEKDVGLEKSPFEEAGANENAKSTRRQVFLMHKKYWLGLFYLTFGLLMTGWWIAGLILNRHKYGWVIPFLLWLAITLRLITLYVPTKFVMTGINYVWTRTVKQPVELIPSKFRTPLAAAGTVAVFLVGSLVPAETPGNSRANRAVSLFGLVVFLFFFWVTSKDRRRVKWQTVIVGMLAQYILALFVLRTKAGFDIFNFIGFLAQSLLGFAAQGAVFLTSQEVVDQHYFLTGVIPPIIFFIAFVQLLYYWGWLQWFIKKFATVFFYTMKVSGAEAVVAAASPFVGQGESAMLIKPFLPHLTDAELHQVMTSGFATISGSVLAVYIGFGISPQALISSCVMSIPASLAISKLRYPETEETLTSGSIIIPENEDEEKPQNSLHAFANGSWLGIKVAGMIVACLLTILALLGLCNGLLFYWGKYLNINHPELSVQLIVGYIFWPVAFLLGVNRENGDILKVAKIIGIKIVANEFVAFTTLTDGSVDLADRSRLIATYAVCGFGNISSVGIQIGVLSQLAPGRGGRIARVALSALVSGVLSTLTSASIAGMLIVDASKYTVVGPKTA